jgi:hypothetical protein
MMITDENGNQFQATEMFGALSLDDGKTWSYKRIIGPDGPQQFAECTDGGMVTIGGRSSEHRGYLSVCQSLDGVIHLISSRQHYAFNQKWMMTPQPAPGEPVKVKHEVESFKGPQFDLDHWGHYKSYTGGFNGKGQYSINSIMAYGGLARVVGTGSFDAVFALDNMKLDPRFSWREVAFGFKDKFRITWFLVFNSSGEQLNIYLKDQNPKPDYKRPRGEAVKLTEFPKSIKARFTFDEETGRCRVFYGLNGDEAVTEMAQSKVGLYLGEPFSESNAAYILISDASATVDHFEIKPLNR